MKKVLAVLALVVFTSVMVTSCTPEDSTSQDELYDTLSEDKDDEEDKG